MRKKTALILSTILITNSVFAYSSIALQEKQGTNNTKLALEDDGLGALSSLLGGDLNLDDTTNTTTNNSSDNQTTQTSNTSNNQENTNTQTNNQNDNSNETDPFNSLNALLGGDLNTDENSTNNNQENTSNINLGPKTNNNNELDNINNATVKTLYQKKFLYIINLKETKNKLKLSTVKKLDEVLEKLPFEKIKNIVKNASKLDLKKSKYRYIIQYLASKSALKIIKLKLEKQYLTENLAKAKKELENYAKTDDSMNTIDPKKIENNIERNVKKLPDYALKCTYEKLSKASKTANLTGLNKILLDYLVAKTGLENIERKGKVNNDYMKMQMRMDPINKSNLTIIANALQMYFNDNGFYPKGNDTNNIKTKLVPTYMPEMPYNTLTNKPYFYKSIYHKGAEDAGFVLGVKMLSSKNCNMNIYSEEQLSNLIKNLETNGDNDTSSYLNKTIYNDLKKKEFKDGCYYVLVY